ncbi:nuclear transport factor 2 family protein [Undibacterium sp.]|uniref:nuclear transport factor 2 family protein n=1 Tax=Undibacterium sp. TaxID=1914977 RepID=UPI00374D8FF0
MTTSRFYLKCLSALLASILLTGLAQAQSPMTPAQSTVDKASPEEAKAIHTLLDTYTQSVTDRNKALFESLLLDENIPFFCVEDLSRPSFQASTKTVSSYAGFRKSVFDSGTRFHQTFSNVKIEQEGALAQVSLNFETLVDGTNDGGRGWKVLHLLKINGKWKIASEFYTAYSIKKSA